jgi:hypothetical protein
VVSGKEAVAAEVAANAPTQPAPHPQQRHADLLQAQARRIAEPEAVNAPLVAVRHAEAEVAAGHPLPPSMKR